MNNHTIIRSTIIGFIAACNILNGAQINYSEDETQNYILKGYSYFHGNNESKEKDHKKAYEYFLKAALTGNPEAERLVGSCMTYGYGVEKNHHEAFRWYEKSANQGDAYALFNLAFCYESGQGTDVNNQKAKHYYQLAAEKGLAAAYLNLGLLYLSDGDDYQKAFNLFAAAAQNTTTSKIAKLSMAVMYECRLGVASNKKLADAMYSQVKKELNGNPIEGGKNENEISLGRGKAEIFIKGFCYSNAVGVPKDDSKAMVYWNKASKMGMKAAKNWIEQLGNRGKAGSAEIKKNKEDKKS